MMHFTKPVFLVDKFRAESNIDRMLAKAKRSSVVFRPHFKTHQSLEVGQLFSQKGITQITVSSVSMARFFAADGWQDITIAFPLNILEMDELNQLAKQVHLNVLVESTGVAHRLNVQAQAPMGVFIKIDTGYHRTGLLPKQTDEIDAILKILRTSGDLSFKGFLTHAGNTYHAKGKEEILEIKASAEAQLNSLKKKYIHEFPDLMLSYGDTPSCSLADDFPELDEIRPGNFVYYDVMQYHLGSCSLSDIAVALACPVVAVHPDRNELVVYGGGVHLSKEFIAADRGFQLFGYVVRLNDDGRWTDPIAGAYVSSLSQEHGIVRMPSEELKKWEPGDVLGILPVHSCMTADLMKGDTILLE
ncbi:MAG: alanine racemase [Bacteroidales bacterium]|nr:alanine racemase [Bacteroidales bacterium]